MPLQEMGTFYFGLFVAFIAFLIFAGMNIITGIFVDCALQTAVQERDLIMERHAQLEEVSVEHLREVFFHMDGEEDGFIDFQKFGECLCDERVQVYMSALKIETDDASQLFHLLDADNSGEILIDEFVEGCMKLRGEARSMDIHILICENRRMWTKFGIFCEQLHNTMSNISGGMERLGVLVHSSAPCSFSQPLSTHSSRRPSRRVSGITQEAAPFSGQRMSKQMNPAYIIQEVERRLTASQNPTPVHRLSEGHSEDTETMLPVLPGSVP
jgi:hypothetical protein